MEAKVLSPANLKQAGVARSEIQPLRTRIDALRIEDFPAYAESTWPPIRQTLCEGRYQSTSGATGDCVSPRSPIGGERALGHPRPLLIGSSDKLIAVVTKTS